MKMYFFKYLNNVFYFNASAKVGKYFSLYKARKKITDDDQTYETIVSNK